MADKLRLQVLLDGIDRLSGPLKRITAGATGTRAALKTTAAELAAMRRQSGDITSYQRLRAELRGVDRDLEASRARSAAVVPVIEQMRARHHALAGEVKAGRAALKQQGDALAKAKRPSVALTEAYAKQKAELAELERRYSRSTTSLRAANTGLRAGEQATNRLVQRQQALGAQLDQTRIRLERAGVGTSQMATRQRALRGELTQTTAKLEQQRRQLERMQAVQQRAKAMHSAGMTAAMHGAGFTLAGQRALRGAVAPVGAAMDFESSMADVKKVVNFDTPQQFKQMGTDIENLSMRLPMVPSQIAQIVAAAGQANVPRQELLRFAEDAAKMGVAFDSTAEESGQTMATWRTAFRMNQDAVVAMADKINYLGNTGPANVQKITDVVNRIGALGEVAGLPSGPLAALGATVAGMGIESEVSATGIKNMLITLNAGDAATKRQRGAFKLLGIDARKMAVAMQKDAGGAIVSVLEKIRQLPKEQQAATMTTLFGRESIGAIAPLLTNLELLQDNFRKVGDEAIYGGSMQKEYAARVATSANSLQLAKNTAVVLAQTVGDTLIPDFKALAASTGAVVERMVNWMRAHPQLVGWIAKAAIVGAVLVTVLGGLLTAAGLGAMAFGQIYKGVALLARLGPVVGKAGGFIGRAFGQIYRGVALLARLGPVVGKAGGFIGRALLGVGRAALVAGRMLLTTPLGLALGLLAGAAYLVWKNWDGIKAGAILLWHDIANAVGAALLWVSGRISAIWDGIKTYLSGAWAVITGIFSGDGARVSAGLQAMWGVVNGALSGWPARLMEIGRNIMRGLVSGISGMAGAVTGTLGNIARGAVGKVKTLLGIKSPSRVFAALGGHTIDGFTQGLLGGELGAQRALGRIGNGLRATAAGIALGAAGTVVAGNAPALDTRPPLGARGTGGLGGAPSAAAHYEIHIHAAPGMDAQDVARAVAAELDRRELAKRANVRARLSDID